jgi:hypothetical protein
MLKSQCITIWLLGVAPVQPCSAMPERPVAATEARVSVVRADLWHDLLRWYLECLERFLQCDPPTGTLEEEMQSVSHCYSELGIPVGADPEYGRDLVRTTYRHLMAAPSTLERTAVEQFRMTLIQMYVELGGNPAEL